MAHDVDKQVEAAVVGTAVWVYIVHNNKEPIAGKAAMERHGPKKNKHLPLIGEKRLWPWTLELEWSLKVSCLGIRLPCL